MIMFDLMYRYIIYAQGQETKGYETSHMKKENCVGVLFELTAVEDGGNIFYLT
jgi:hypothetical protein